MFHFHKQSLTCYYKYQVILISLYYKINAEMFGRKKRMQNEIRESEIER